ncbi:MAG: Xaa-Pro peptidase family protein [Coriobacteriaceae bacterium]|nr:Xaa-Pro peptidase family protein [Coriobacteriaceae bacterium]
MAHVDSSRVARVLAELNRIEAGAQLLINDPWSIYYLTGFYANMFERFSGVLLKPGQKPEILVNALHQLPAYDNAQVFYHEDTDDVCAKIAERLDPSLPLGVDTVMRSGFLLPLMERHAAPSFFLGSDAVTNCRKHKDERERELMRESSAANDRVLQQAIRLVHEGVTEQEVASRLLDLYRAEGCEGFSFDPIVSFGANAADPHHEPDATALKAGDVVLFDIGGQRSCYCSDMTRTYFWGEPAPEAERIHQIVCAANEAAERIVRPGVRFCDIDRAARDVIEAAGYGRYFTHRLGHSIGMQDHEPGDVSLVNEDVVEPGMTFSIEPGIYLPGKYGVRIEDLVLVTEDGCEILNSVPHQAVRLDLL